MSTVGGPDRAAPRAPGTSDEARFAWAALGLVLALLAVAVVVGVTVSSQFQNSYAQFSSRTRTYPEPVRTLDLSVAQGGATIVVGNGSRTVVESSGTRSTSVPTDDEHLRRGTLTVASTCGTPAFLGPNGQHCSRDYVIRVPARTRISVTLTTGPLVVEGDAGSLHATIANGSLLVSGGVGGVTASTGTGPITVRRTRGILTLRTANGTVNVLGATTAVRITAGTGSVTAVGLTAASVTANAASGSVSLQFATPPQRVDATSGTGAVTLRLPSSASYQLQLASGTGPVASTLRSDPTSSRVVRATTANGAVTVNSAGR